MYSSTRGSPSIFQTVIYHCSPQARVGGDVHGFARVHIRTPELSEFQPLRLRSVLQWWDAQGGVGELELCMLRRGDPTP